ncbi:MAG TPA: M48 family metallopeptidase [Steroidobacteraceae bacterium]|nr:M48 family metallopeptidase [Steroidobacteraceae bacterium]
MTSRKCLLTLVGALLIFLCAGISLAKEVAPELPPGTYIPDVARPGPAFDVERATEAYLAMLDPEQRARSDAYFEGGYWLQLWQFLYSAGVLVLILWRGWSVRMRALAERVSKRPMLQTALFVGMFAPLFWLLTLPLSWYTDFFREHLYGMSNQDLWGWLWDQVKNLFALTVLGIIVLSGIYALVRRASERAWLWATGFMFLFMMFFLLITPVFLLPLFNDYKPLEEGPVREAVLSLAHANQVPVDNVMWFDASKQTKRVSANVSGLFGTTRVSLNDNLLNRTSLPEIKSVMGHEMGHYVLHHQIIGTIFFTVVFGVGFLLLHNAFERMLPAWGARLGIKGRPDPAGLPFALLVLSVYFFLVTPFVNRFTYTFESEADLFGLNAAREPYGFATSAMRLGAYRKLEPSKLEELLFFDHPSGRERVEMAMKWLKENQALFASQPAETSGN